MKALKEFAVNGQLFTVGDEVPESLVTTAMIESGKVQGENREEGLLIEEPSAEVEISKEAEVSTESESENSSGESEEGSEEPQESQEEKESDSQEYPAEVETKSKPKGRSRKS